MNLVLSLLVLSTLLQLVQPVVPPLLIRTVVEITSGDSKVFSGENVQLRCSIPDDYNFTWQYLWFRESEQLPQNGENIVLRNTNIKNSGKYYCQGFRNSIVGKIYTRKSLPVGIIVDGGWAILQVPSHPALVGESLMMTCHVRRKPPLTEAILYKDGVEVLRQKDPNGHLHLTNLTLEDGGLYSCRASWDTFKNTISVISTVTPLQVLEVLTQPIMKIVNDSPLSPSNMKLVCNVEYNARDPAPPVYFYFYKNNNYLGMATSHNYVRVMQSPGTFTCRAVVPQMGISRQSDSKSYGQLTGNAPWTSTSQNMALFSSSEPLKDQSFTYPPTAPTMDSTQSSQPPLMTSQPPLMTSQPPLMTSQPPLMTSQPPLMTSQPALTTLSPPFQSANNQTVTSETEDASGGSGEMSVDSPDADME